MTRTTAEKNADLETVMAKLEKLRAMAERGTEHEVEIASAKMNKLLLEYNLSLYDIERHAQKTGRTVTHDSYPSGYARWKIDLLFCVSRAHMCKAVYHQGSKQRRGDKGGTMTVVGHDHNLIVVRETWQWLMREVERLDGPAADASGVWYQGGKAAITQWMKDYRMGFVAGIGDAYDAMREEVKAETDEQRWGLVAVIDAEVMTTFHEMFPSLGHRKGATIGHLDAFGEGRVAGRNTNLGRQVGNGGTKTAIA